MRRYKIRTAVLRQWKAREGRSYRWLAGRIGLTPATLSEQLVGRTGVSLGTALALEAETGFSIRDLVEPMGADA